MKLLVCKNCADVFSLATRLKTCGCGKSSGRYVDNLNAEISGPCEPIGFANSSFRGAYELHKKSNGNGDKGGFEFIAFFIPDRATSVKRIDKDVKQSA